MNYETAKERLGNRQSRKVANNTYLQARENGTIAVMLHSTDIVIFHPNGNVELQSGGWKTVTTKARMNEFSGLIISQTKGLWSVAPGWEDDDTWGTKRAQSVPYADGITWNPKRGKFQGAGKVDAPKQELKLRKEVRKYATAYLKALKAGDVPAPSAGDCWYCGMKEVETGKPLGECTKDGEHIRSHIKENYFVPSLIVNAFKAMGAAQVQMWGLGAIWNPDGKDNRMMIDWATDDRSQRMLTRYLYRQLGVAA